MRRRFKSAARAGRHAVLGRPQIGVFIRARTAQRAVPTRTKHPLLVSAGAGVLFWRRPTLARPIVVLPSGLQRFTAVFGMGTGGSTALGSPEICPAVAGQISGGGAIAPRD